MSQYLFYLYGNLCWGQGPWCHVYMTSCFSRNLKKGWQSHPTRQKVASDSDVQYVTKISICCTWNLLKCKMDGSKTSSDQEEAPKNRAQPFYCKTGASPCASTGMISIAFAATPGLLIVLSHLHVKAGCLGEFPCVTARIFNAQIIFRHLAISRIFKSLSLTTLYC